MQLTVLLSSLAVLAACLFVSVGSVPTKTIQTDSIVSRFQGPGGDSGSGGSSGQGAPRPSDDPIPVRGGSSPGGPPKFKPRFQGPGGDSGSGGSSGPGAPRPSDDPIPVRGGSSPGGPPSRF